METLKVFFLTMLLCLAPACSPRDFLTRRLADDLISASGAFKAPQVFWLKTGLVSNQDFNSPDSLVLQRHGWIVGTQGNCPAGVDPAPCWDVVLSPHGVDVFRSLITESTHGGTRMPINVARREIVDITGISKAGNLADVEFLWHWVPMNEVGSALYDSGVRYRSTVGFRRYDDGWRVQTEAMRSNQPIDDSLRGAQPVP
jgi:hypothetical protein